MAYGKISAKQQEILEYIKQEILNKGYPPAVREICEAVHLKSTSSVHSHLETLEKNGYIEIVEKEVERNPFIHKVIEKSQDNDSVKTKKYKVNDDTEVEVEEHEENLDKNNGQTLS